MATYTEEYDHALLETPWLAKSDTAGKPYLLKCIRHPSKPGFIALLTDLTKVYFEPLVGIRLLARQREVEEQHGESQRRKDGGGSSLDMGGEEAVTETLEDLDGLMSHGLQEAELSATSGDLYDLDLVLKSSESNWVFHMTEIRYGCLEIITRHMIHPLALSITSSKRPKQSTDTQILQLVSSKTVLQAVNQHSVHAATSARAKPSPKPKKTTPTPAAEDSTSQASGSKPRLVRRRPKTVTPEAQAEQQGKSPSPTLRNTSPVKGKRKEKQAEPEEDEMMPEEADSPIRASPTPPPPQSKRAASKSPPAKEGADADGGGAAGDEEMRDADDDEEAAEPPAPPPPRPSQKTQQEKDEEEEAELERKREEMKRKMGAGGGGRLVRRRFGR